MALFNALSPGVTVREIDLTLIIPGVATSIGAYVPTAVWGPVEDIRLIDTETTYVNTYGKPDSNSYISFYTATNFLAYTNALYVSRACGANARNSMANTHANATTILIKNETAFENTYLYATTANAYGSFVARYPGKLGDILKVSVCANYNNFSTWAYNKYFDNPPGTSTYVSDRGGANDELHLVVVDTTGKISGTANTVIEKFAYLSKASDAVGIDGTSSYYKQKIFHDSQYIYAMDPVDYANTSSTWGTESFNKTFANPSSIFEYTLAGGKDEVPTNSNLFTNWDLFKDKDTYDISLVLTGNSDANTQQYLIDNLVDSNINGIQGRKDSVVFLSPRQGDVVAQSGQEATNIVNNYLAALNRSSSYAVVDSGWKYQFDKYNNLYRWIPLNADLAGLCARTDLTNAPWYSPAGFNRGQIKNIVKLAWSPTQTYRDLLYVNGVNPVVSFKGEGPVLFGDKTLQAKPSAFDRINVRRLFIVLEKAISKAAKYSLFEFNDQFTRSQFVSLVEPFLREVKAGRGIYDFKVVCDESNNTGVVIDSNQFVGDIYIKPAKSINYILLNFVAVKSSVDFNTVIGQF